MTSLSCPICRNSNNFQTLRATDYFLGSLDNFTYNRCDQCGHLVLVFEDHVGGGEFGRGKFDAKDEKVVVDILDHPVLGWGFYQPRSRWIASRTGLGNHHKVLDVGCGSGHFLQTIHRQSGCECVGLDLDPVFEQNASKVAVRRVTGDFEKYDTSERFDLITMFHLIEHLNNPAASIRKAWELLKPGGYLYIETPAADSLAFGIFKEYWLPWFPPYHRHVFTRSSLSQLMGEHFENGGQIQPAACWVPLEVIVSTWLWWGRIGPHPFRRGKHSLPLKLIAMLGMGLSSVLALPIELAVGATTDIVDSMSGFRLLLAAHQRVLCKKA